ncbi:hypothetical protein G7Z17_g5487 [Cylindrodendrum hubeiense]|uniref:Uncharacterized protein n=1 Tax=Cylindrodendrum hubeiense TaxID=595255 RepID=A0A9P5HAQ8_9HYPO|nr:hypothetical protein G7Z17_g5487 [Cylindrodendrum hubeiense]
MAELVKFPGLCPTALDELRHGTAQRDLDGLEDFEGSESFASPNRDPRIASLADGDTWANGQGSMATTWPRSPRCAGDDGGSGSGGGRARDGLARSSLAIAACERACEPLSRGLGRDDSSGPLVPGDGEQQQQWARWTLARQGAASTSAWEGLHQRLGGHPPAPGRASTAWDGECFKGRLGPLGGHGVLSGTHSWRPDADADVACRWRVPDAASLAEAVTPRLQGAAKHGQASGDGAPLQPATLRAVSHAHASSILPGSQSPMFPRYRAPTPAVVVDSTLTPTPPTAPVTCNRCWRLRRRRKQKPAARVPSAPAASIDSVLSPPVSLPVSLPVSPPVSPSIPVVGSRTSANLPPSSTLSLNPAEPRAPVNRSARRLVNNGHHHHRDLASESSISSDST